MVEGRRRGLMSLRPIACVMQIGFEMFRGKSKFRASAFRASSVSPLIHCQLPGAIFFPLSSERRSVSGARR
ncbi:uncharacterized [Tachysurus ichikawai]